MAAVATPDTFFGNRGILTIDAGTPCAVFKGIELTPKYDVAKLYGGRDGSMDLTVTGA